MSQKNVENHNRIYGALNAGDADALMALCDESVAIRSTFAAVRGATYRGSFSDPSLDVVHKAEPR